MTNAFRPLAIATGASTGIGYELALVCARNGFDLIVAADEPRIHEAADDFRAAGAAVVESVESDLSTIEGNDEVLARVKHLGRPVEALLANAGSGHGHAFLDQEFGMIRRTIDTNITGTLYLIHAVARGMRDRKTGRVLIIGSIAGYMPGSFQAVYNSTKAFLNSFSFALRDELKTAGVTVTVLKPGATETPFFERADMLDTKVGAAKKDDPADVAKLGFEAMMRGDGDVVYGLKNKLMTVAANVTPSGVLAGQHRKMSEPGTADR